MYSESKRVIKSYLHYCWLPVKEWMGFTKKHTVYVTENYNALFATKVTTWNIRNNHYADIPSTSLEREVERLCISLNFPIGEVPDQIIVLQNG